MELWIFTYHDTQISTVSALKIVFSIHCEAFLQPTRTISATIYPFTNSGWWKEIKLLWVSLLQDADDRCCTHLVANHLVFCCGVYLLPEEACMPVCICFELSNISMFPALWFFPNSLTILLPDLQCWSRCFHYLWPLFLGWLMCVGNVYI